MKKLKIGIVGSGISGLSAAWLLSKYCETHIFEKNNYLGGHSNTITIKTFSNEEIDVDTGFIVFNRLNYPNFSSFIDQLSVKTITSDMSFSASINNGELEYSGKNFSTMFVQKKNLIDLSFWHMLFDIHKFFNNAEKDIHNYSKLTINEYLKKKKYSKFFKDNFLFPMAGSIWSIGVSEIGNYPFRSFVRFFRNHGLLKFFNRPQWETILGGSKCYVNKVIKNKKIKVFLNETVTDLKRIRGKLALVTQKQNIIFDHVIFANHSNQALTIIKNLDLDDKQYLSKIKYKRNIAYLHSDKAYMPKNQKAWSSWNYISTKNNNVCVTYWMNLLQNLESKQDIFVTLNPEIPPEQGKIFKKILYEHPIFNNEAISSQKKINQNNKDIWFCGAYMGYGFHEDGIKSGLDIAERITKCQRPWKK